APGVYPFGGLHSRRGALRCCHGRRAGANGAGRADDTHLRRDAQRRVDRSGGRRLDERVGQARDDSDRGCGWRPLVKTNEASVRRSVVAVMAGFLATAVLSLGTDVVLHALRVFPPWGEPMSSGLFVWATVYRVAFTVLGGFMTARIAPRKPMTHVLVLGMIGI